MQGYLLTQFLSSQAEQPEPFPSHDSGIGSAGSGPANQEQQLKAVAGYISSENLIFTLRRNLSV